MEVSAEEPGAEGGVLRWVWGPVADGFHLDIAPCGLGMRVRCQLRLVCVPLLSSEVFLVINNYLCSAISKDPFPQEGGGQTLSKMHMD